MAGTSIQFEMRRQTEGVILSSLEAATGAPISLERVSATTISGAHVAGDSVQFVLQQDSILCRQVIISFPGYAVRIDRPTEGGHNKLKTGAADTVTIDIEDGGDPKHVLGIVANVRRGLFPIDEISVPANPAEADREFYLAREESLRRLQHIQDAFFGKLRDFTISQEEQFQQRHKDLVEMFVARQQDLEDEYVKKSTALAEQESALKIRIAELDDRESRHVRRDLQKQFKKTFADRETKFELTTGTHGRRRVVFALCILLLVIQAAVAVIAAVAQYNATGSDKYWFVGQQIGWSLAFVVTAGLFIKWNNAWFRRHADEEFLLKRMELDIDRASWVVETALDWSNEKGEAIPQSLIDRLSRNLFVRDDSKDDALTATDAVASALLGSASTLELKHGDSAVRLDRKGLRRLSKTEIDPV